MFKGLKPIVYGGREVWPLVEGGKGVAATNHASAGAWAATLYCLHCPESSAMFVLTWYSLGIAFTTLLGALVGPRILRW